jgi:hypothetical protein
MTKLVPENFSSLTMTFHVTAPADGPRPEPDYSTLHQAAVFFEDVSQYYPPIIIPIVVGGDIFK